MTATLAPTIVGQTRLNLTRGDPTTAREITASVERFYQAFPHAAAGLQSVSIGSPDFDDSPQAYAFTQPIDLSDPAPPYSIVLNPAMYGEGTRRRLVATAASDYAHFWHGYAKPAGTFEHELAHVIDFYVASLRGLKIPASFAAFQAGKWDAPDAYDLSQYAVQGGPAEAFAEAFANTWQGVPVRNVRVRRLLDDITSAAAK